MRMHLAEDGRCLNLGCLHRLEEHCSKRCETEEKIADQIWWLRLCHWQQKKPWMAREVKEIKGKSPIS